MSNTDADAVVTAIALPVLSYELKNMTSEDSDQPGYPVKRISLHYVLCIAKD